MVFETHYYLLSATEIASRHSSSTAVGGQAHQQPQIVSANIFSNQSDIPRKLKRASFWLEAKRRAAAAQIEMNK